MKITSLMLIVALMMFFAPSMASALDLGVTTSITGGASLGTHVLLECTGYSYLPANDPWTQCPTQTVGGTTLAFGTLSTRLKTPLGADAGGAGCFYAEKFFIVYLFPDAWGGTGYQLNQQASSSSAAILDALVFAPVYASADKYSTTGSPQGAMNPTEVTDNPNINKATQAKNSAMIFKSKTARIVRAEYGIPPYPASGSPVGTPVPISTPNNSYTVSITISLTTYI
ncbi:MAG: hypothetical protein V2A59_00430 [Candidatus Omnitrophota bacterium]